MTMATDDPQHGVLSADSSELGLFNSNCLELIETVLSLVPDYARNLILEYERTRSETTEDERGGAYGEVIGAARNESDALVIKAGLNAVIYANWAMRDAAKYGEPGFFSYHTFAEASRLLGGIQGHRGAIPDRDVIMQQSISALGRSGGIARAARYEPMKEQVKALYAQWQAGALTIPTARSGRRVEDFDGYAAEAVGVSERAIRDWRSTW